MVNTLDKLRKSDWIIYPVIAIIFVMSFLSYNFQKLILPFYLTLICLFIIFFIIFDFEKSMMICLSVYLFDNIVNYDSQKIALTSLMSSIFCFVYLIKYIVDIFRKKQKPHWILIGLNVALIAYAFLIGFKFDFEHIKIVLNHAVLITNLYLTFCYAKQINLKKIVIAFTLILSTLVLLSILFYSIEKFKILFVLNKRFRAFTANPNTLQIFCVLALSMLLVLFYKKIINWWQFGLMIIAPIVAGILTMSKTYLICLIILLIFFILLMFRSSWKFGLISVGSVAIIGVVACIVFWDKFSSIVDRFTQYNYDNIWDKLLTGRYSIWKTYIQEWSSSVKNIILGCGVTVDEIIEIGSHSAYINLIYRFGIVGVLLIGSVVSAYILQINDKKRRFKLSGTIPLVLFLIIAIEESIFSLKFGYIFMLIVLFLFETQSFVKRED